MTVDQKEIQCIRHAPGSTFAVLRPEYAYLFSGNRSVATLVAALEYLTNRRLASLKDAESRTAPWIVITQDNLMGYMFGYTPRSLHRALWILDKLGLLDDKSQNRSKYHRLLFNYERCQELLDSHKQLDMPVPGDATEDEDEQSSGNSFQMPTETVSVTNGNGVHSSGNSFQSANIRNARAEIIENTKREQPSEQDLVVDGKDSEEQTPPEPEAVTDPPAPPSPDTGEVDEREPGPSITKRLYRQSRGAVLPRLDTKRFADVAERLQKLKDGAGAVLFTKALKCYLASESENVRREKYPIRWFCSQFDHWLQQAEGSIPPPPPHKPASSVAIPGVRAAREIPQPAPKEQPWRFSALEVVGKWSAMVPSAPPIKKWLDKWTAAAQDADFLKNLDEILRTVEQMICGGKLKFTPTCGWLLKDQNWARVLEHEFDWAFEGTEPAPEAKSLSQDSPAPPAEDRSDWTEYELVLGHKVYTDEERPFKIQAHRRSQFIERFQMSIDEAMRDLVLRWWKVLHQAMETEELKAAMDELEPLSMEQAAKRLEEMEKAQQQAF